MLPPEYTKAVLAEYRRKTAANTLPIDMRQLSPAGFKAACLEVCRERYNRKDEFILKAFFGEGSDQENCLRAIARRDIDKFRPLVNFLKGRTTKPDGKIVELAAWLIDFNLRPYDPQIKYVINPDTISVSPQRAPANGTIEIPQAESGEIDDASRSTSSEVRKKGKKRKKITLVITITVAVAMIIYLVRTNKPLAPVYIGHQACMFWNEDHYQPISCQPHGDTMVVALDSNRLVHFRKITQPDTITANAIGTIWYVRYRKDYEFYTADGYHPIDPNLWLRPITEYIIRNHIHPKQ
jgi:hypothetical protein